MRGSRTLFTGLIVDDAPAPKAERGRSLSLINRRNELAMDRYLFYSNKYSWRYDKLIEEVSNEVFLTHRTLIELMSQPTNRAYLHRLRKEEPGPDFFKKKWPWMNWG